MTPEQRETAVADMIRYFEEIGLVIPAPAPVALRWGPTGSCVEIPADDAGEDDLVIYPDPIDLDHLAYTCADIVCQATRKAPGRFHHRHWRIKRRLASFLYCSGITGSGGSWGWDEYGSNYRLPSLRSVRYRRPYLLWKPSWWWGCHKRQGFRVRGRHQPEEPFILSFCAACLPCPSCGAHQGCTDDCEFVG